MRRHRNGKKSVFIRNRAFRNRQHPIAMSALLLSAALLLSSAAEAINPELADAEAPPLTVLEPVTADVGVEQQPDQVAARIARKASSKPMGKESATFVMDAATGQELFNDNGGTNLIPASSAKIPTAAGVLLATGGQSRITTKVTQSGGTLYLVGGGDPLLSSRKPPAGSDVPDYPKLTSMKALARDTAAAIGTESGSEIKLKFDDSLFSGPDWGPDWPEYYRTSGIVAPVSALIVDDAQLAPQGSKVAQPAQVAADRFAQLLKQRGVTVGKVDRGRSPQDAAEIASVESVPMHAVVAQTLSTSDNDTAEMLFRLAGIGAGYEGSFAGGSRAVQEALGSVGIATDGARFEDGSGLSRLNKVSPKILSEILRRAVTRQDELWPVASGLAVGGATGTLKFRFDDMTTERAAGWARGKTGTLNYVGSLSGFVQSESGRVLVYSSIANEADSSFDASAKIDEIVTELADCGCPGKGR